MIRIVGTSATQTEAAAPKANVVAVVVELVGEVVVVGVTGVVLDDVVVVPGSVVDVVDEVAGCVDDPVGVVDVVVVEVDGGGELVVVDATDEDVVVVLTFVFGMHGGSGHGFSVVVVGEVLGTSRTEKWETSLPDEWVMLTVVTGGL